jgi:hypothetical protein
MFKNPPVGTWMYIDHEEKCTKVFVAIPMISEVSDIKFELAENGQQVTIEYPWPTAIFRALELFEDDIKSQNTLTKIDATHPKIHSYTSELLNMGITENSNPKGAIIVQLPIKVQTDIGSWKKRAIKKENGTKIAFLEFKGFQQQQIINEADTTISFN